MRNPKWTEEEVILLVDLYYEHMKHNQCLVNCPLQLQGLSDLLKNHAISRNLQISDTFRNLSGLKMKCANIKSLIEGGGLSHTSSLEQAIVEMMISDPAGLHEKAEKIREEWIKET